MSEKSLKQRLRAFQKEMHGVEIIKNTKAYGYNYATLKDILFVIEPILDEHGIWYQHNTGFDHDSKQNTVHTFIYSVDNEDDRESCTTLIDKEATLAKMNRFMIEGSAITYFRRYHITTLLGLTTDEDTDAGGKKVEKGGRSVEAASGNAGPDFEAI